MSAKYMIGVWGQYGDGGKIADGQAVRTTIITNELKLRYGKEKIQTTNTNNWRRHPIKLLINSFKLIAQSKNVIVLPADNGFKVFIPILFTINKVFRRKLYYVVIGGFLPQLLKEKPKYRKLVNKFEAIFVQTDNIKKDLETLGIQNVHILSNPKRLNTRTIDSITKNVDKHIKVCVFSRIYQDKGVEDAIEAVRMANEKLGDTYIELDMYGLVPDIYKERLHILLQENSGFVKYNGIIDYDKTVETLQSYFLMLFPTYYHGEGFPGNVIDAFNSGLPIIATDWLYNKDFIEPGRNGEIVPIKSPNELCNAILKLYKDRETWYRYAKNCLEDAKKYSPDKVLDTFYRVLENRNEKEN